MSDMYEDYVGKIQQFIVFLEQEFICEECEDNLTEGCLSCDAIKARHELENMLATLFYPDAKP